jgi:integrase
MNWGHHVATVFWDTKILKDGSRRYYLRSKIGDTRRSHGSCRTLRDAQTLKGEILKSIADGTYFKAPPRTATFSAFADQWLSDYAGVKVKPSTKDDYTGVVNKHLKPFFKDTPLASIDAKLVQDYVSEKVREGLSPRTVNKTVTVLKLMFKHAVIWGYLTDNPAQYVERPREAKQEREYFRPSEIRRLLEASPPDYKPLYAIAALAGLRQGEVLALRWSDIDLEQNVIFVRRSWNDKHGFGEPKSQNSSRAVDVSPQLAMILKQYKLETHGVPDDLLFAGEVEGKPLSRQNLVQKHFYGTLKTAGVKRVEFHALRHSYATLMIASGANMKYLQHQMGHSSIRVTMDMYGHLLPEVGEGVGKRLDSLIWDSKVIQLPSAENGPNETS